MWPLPASNGTNNEQYADRGNRRRPRRRWSRRLQSHRWRSSDRCQASQLCGWPAASRLVAAPTWCRTLPSRTQHHHPGDRRDQADRRHRPGRTFPAGADLVVMASQPKVAANPLGIHVAGMVHSLTLLEIAICSRRRLSAMVGRVDQFGDVSIRRHRQVAQPENQPCIPGIAAMAAMQTAADVYRGCGECPDSAISRRKRIDLEPLGVAETSQLTNRWGAPESPPFPFPPHRFPITT